MVGPRCAHNREAPGGRCRILTYVPQYSLTFCSQYQPWPLLAQAKPSYSTFVKISRLATRWEYPPPPPFPTEYEYRTALTLCMQSYSISHRRASWRSCFHCLVITSPRQRRRISFGQRSLKRRAMFTALDARICSMFEETLDDVEGRVMTPIGRCRCLQGRAIHAALGIDIRTVLEKQLRDVQGPVAHRGL
ncbi:hypothetical protein BC834DRAFT_911452 [Gloeopeniophorella convolvens]|nr:hypothetical protein BC834DRAFT_911452 [Gloeopeniophorella convolvens]